MKNKISVIIPVTRPNRVPKIIKKIITQKGANKISEIILVGKKLPLIKNKTKIILAKTRNILNPATARNKGADLARGDILIFLDDDCEPIESWLIQSIEAVKPKNVAAAGGRILGASRKYFAQCVDFCNFTFVQSRKKREMPISSASLVIKNKVFQKVGIFDENLRIGEDTDLCMRINRMGYKTIFEPKIIVLHHHNRSSLKKLLSYQFQNGKIKGLYIENKYPRGFWFRFLRRISHPLTYWLFILPFAILASLIALAVNIREYPKVIILLPGIFLGKLSAQLGIFYWTLKKVNLKIL